MVLAFVITSFHAARIQERLFRNIVEVTADERLEAAHGLVDRDVDAGQAGEDLRDEQRLRQEPLDLACPGHAQAVLFRELVEARMAMMSCSSRARCSTS